MNLDFQYLFTSFDGRINRAKWWAGMVILAVVNVVLGFILSPYSAHPFSPGYSAFIIALALFYPTYAVAPNASRTATSPASWPFMAWSRLLIASLLQSFG